MQPASQRVHFRGARRLTGVEEWVWYLLAGISYTLAGVWHKWLLNWLMGPIWLVTVIVVGPWLFDRCRAVIGRRPGGDGPGDDAT